MAKCTKLFTYGTLMEGQRLSHFMANGATLLSQGITLGEIQSAYGVYPIALHAPGIIHGELYQITNPTLWATLDRVEQGYCRRVTQILLADGKVVPAYMYWFIGPYRGEPIPSGDWRKFVLDMSSAVKYPNAMTTQRGAN